MVDFSSVSGLICPWISVASCFNGVERSGHNDFPKSLWPSGSALEQGGRRPGGRCTLKGFAGQAARSNEGQQQQGFAVRITLRPLSTRCYFSPCAREHQCSSALHNFTALRGRPPLPHTRVTIHYVCVSYIRYVSPYISLGARIHLWPSSCPLWTPRLTFTLIIRVTKYCQHSDNQYNWGIIRVTHC